MPQIVIGIVMFTSKKQFFKKQQGAALAICLIILLIMTIVGVNSMSGLVLEERMAGNNRQYMIASEQAEAAIRAGENWVAVNVSNPTTHIAQFDGTNGLYSRVAPAVLPFDIFDTSAWAGNSQPVTTLSNVDPLGVKGQGDLVGRDPAFIVEYFGRASAPDESGKIGGKKLDPNDTTQSQKYHVFRVTGAGWGEDGTTHFLAQSTIRKCLVGSRCQ